MPYELPTGSHQVVENLVTRIPNSLEALRKNETGFVTTAGSANAYTATFSPAHVLASDFVCYLRIHATNTTASTLNVNGTGAKNLMKIQGASVVALGAGDVISGGLYQVMRDQTGDRYIVLTLIPDADKIGPGTLASGVVVPLGRIGISGSHTTVSLAAGATEGFNITHGLGTDDVKVIVMGRGNEAATRNGFLILASRPDGALTMCMGRTDITQTLFPAAASGDVRFTAKNGPAGTQTITVFYTIMRE